MSCVGWATSFAGTGRDPAQAAHEAGARPKTLTLPAPASRPRPTNARMPHGPATRGAVYVVDLPPSSLELYLSLYSENSRAQLGRSALPMLAIQSDTSERNSFW